jgi:hypothetical protein
MENQNTNAIPAGKPAPGVAEVYGTQDLDVILSKVKESLGPQVKSGNEALRTHEKNALIKAIENKKEGLIIQYFVQSLSEFSAQAGKENIDHAQGKISTILEFATSSSSSAGFKKNSYSLLTQAKAQNEKNGQTVIDQHLGALKPFIS